jgi:hypothetical protein
LVRQVARSVRFDSHSQVEEPLEVVTSAHQGPF